MRILAALLLSLAALGARATPTTDYSDLWFIPAESGWGVNVIQQNRILFITLFVYDAGNNPKWYVAPAVQSTGGTTFTGQLFETKGPYFGTVPFNSAAVTNAVVGNISFNATGPNAATLTYNVGATNVTKNIQRQTWQEEDITGVYIGSTIGNFAGCGGADGYFESFATFIISKGAGPVVTLREEGQGYTCTYTGNYVQTGRLGSISGTGTCTDSGSAQAFNATEVQGGVQGLTMKYTAQFTGACSATGRIGGMRKGS